MDTFDSAQSLVMGSIEHGDGPSGFIKKEQSHEQLSNYQLLKNYSVP
jgi:hypothetical protein